jgi:hypothetical protein
MYRTQVLAVALAERMCRPQRIGVFGHRGVGKTTLVTLLYREAVAGRLLDLRLAAADARTANYLSDKILQLESGQPLPGTLAETDLRFHLYQKTNRYELLVKDYQGEHVELGRQEPIRDFLRDCDAVWLCLDAGLVGDAGQNLRRQQEVEQIVEDYLAADPLPGLHRPMGLLLTKADRLDPATLACEQWAEPFTMTRHALHSHCPLNGAFAVSCLKEVKPPDPASAHRVAIEPLNLGDPLTWLASALEAQDQARLDWLFTNSANQLGILERCVACFARRYPDAAATTAFQQRVRHVRLRRYRQRALAIAAGAAGLVMSLWGYDALGYYQAAKFQQSHAAAPQAAFERWQSYQTWHPTRHLTRVSSAEGEETRLGELRRDARQQECEARLAELRRAASDADTDAQELWRQFQVFHSDYPEVNVAGDLEQLRTTIKARRDDELARQAQSAYDELLSAESRMTDLTLLIEQADQFLHRYAGTPLESEVRRRRDALLGRMDERVIEVARAYSAKNQLNFQTRREHYHRYLDKYPRGAAAKEAAAALVAIDREWDKHDFRTVRDHFLTKPGDIPELVARCRTYLAVHSNGQFTAAATELLRWSERVTAPGEYKVVLRNGQFERKIARFFSRGPDLSVEIEVNGIKHGPSSFFKNRYDPEWDYEYPRRIRWKLGDPLVIRVIDNDWRKRVVAEVSSADGDPLAIRMLTGEVWSGNNRVTFESDFSMPVLPKIE